MAFYLDWLCKIKNYEKFNFLHPAFRVNGDIQPFT